MRIGVMPSNVSEALQAAVAVAEEMQRRVGVEGCTRFANRSPRLPAKETFLDGRYCPPLTRSSVYACSASALAPTGHPRWHREQDSFLQRPVGDHRRFFWWPVGRRPGLAVSEPYGLDESSLAAFVSAYGPGSAYDTAIFLDGDSPHFPGRTLLIEVWARPVWNAVWEGLPEPDPRWLDRWVEVAASWYWPPPPASSPPPAPFAVIP